MQRTQRSFYKERNRMQERCLLVKRTDAQHCHFANKIYMLHAVGWAKYKFAPPKIYYILTVVIYFQNVVVCTLVQYCLFQ